MLCEPAPAGAGQRLPGAGQLFRPAPASLRNLFFHSPITLASAGQRPSPITQACAGRRRVAQLGAKTSESERFLKLLFACNFIKNYMSQDFSLFHTPVWVLQNTKKSFPMFSRAFLSVSFFNVRKKPFFCFSIHTFLCTSLRLWFARSWGEKFSHFRVKKAENCYADDTKEFLIL